MNELIKAKASFEVMSEVIGWLMDKAENCAMQAMKYNDELEKNPECEWYTEEIDSLMTKNKAYLDFAKRIAKL